MWTVTWQFARQEEKIMKPSIHAGAFLFFLLMSTTGIEEGGDRRMSVKEKGEVDWEQERVSEVDQAWTPSPDRWERWYILLKYWIKENKNELSESTGQSRVKRVERPFAKTLYSCLTGTNDRRLFLSTYKGKHRDKLCSYATLWDKWSHYSWLKLGREQFIQMSETYPVGHCNKKSLPLCSAFE